MNLLTLPYIEYLAELSFTMDDPVPVAYRSDAQYNIFLLLLARALEPELILELGTHHAFSTAHFAAGAPQSRIVSIDWKPPPPLPYPNVELWAGDTKEMGQRVKDLGISPGLIFLDSTHESWHAQIEFDLYWPLLAPGGIFLCDDINFAEMRRFWAGVPEPKWYSDKLHDTCGFGVVIKQ